MVIIANGHHCEDAHKASGVGYHVLADPPVLSRRRRRGEGGGRAGWLVPRAGGDTGIGCPLEEAGGRRGGYHGEEIIEARVDEEHGVAAGMGGIGGVRIRGRENI